MPELESCVRKKVTSRVVFFEKIFFVSLLALTFSMSSANADLIDCLDSLDWPICGDFCTVNVSSSQVVIATEVTCTFFAKYPNGSIWSRTCNDTTLGALTPLFWAQSCENACAENYQPCPELPPCEECTSAADCENLYGPPEFGIWDCRFCSCLLLNSPLVLYLPDYLSPVNGNQSWWKRGFCGPEAPTVCLDWLGDGNVTCTAWTEPGSGIAFVVALSVDDMLRLAEGASVHAEPWRHFFGNVTKGPEGDHPYAQGFAALAAYCGQDPESSSEIDLKECGLSLFVWDDLSGDGNIGPNELLALQDLGIETLGDVRKTGKKDRCGNTFPVESHATCSGQPGKCGTWLDVFFEPR